MKKMKLLGAATAFLCAALALGSCKSHIHTYTAWEYYAEEHFRICAECGERETANRHSFGAYTVIKEATEAETGTQERLCTVCGYRDITEISCTSHTHTYGVWQITLLPTEDSAGEMTRVCADNPTHTDSAVLPALTAEAYTHTVLTEPDCTKTGLAEYIYVYDGEEIRFSAGLSVLPHSFGPWSMITEATDTQSGQRKRSCTFCGFEETEDIPPLLHTHTYGPWSVETEPTLGQTGSLVRVCSQDSGHTESLTLPVLTDSRYEIAEIEAATCAKEGSALYRITVEEQEFVFYSVIERKEHSFSEEWVCDELYHYHSAICEHSEERKDFGAHSYENGICSICGYSRVSAGLEYRLNADGLSYAVIGIGTTADTDIVIPAEYNGFPVTALADEAFRNQIRIESVRFLGDIGEIGSSAFSGCTSLSAVYFTAVSHIGGNAFEGCTALESLTLPDTVSVIGEYAFLNCRNLTELSLPSALTSLGDYAFSGCEGLTCTVYDTGLYLGNADNPYLVLLRAADTAITSCEIHADTVFIYGSAFSECLKLNAIVIPEQVIDIGHHAFFLCSALQDAVIGGNVKHIGQSAFSDCQNLKTVALPSSLAQIDANAFARCTALEDAMYAGTEEDWERSTVDIGNTLLLAVLRFA